MRWTYFSSRSIPQNRMVWGWGYESVGPSWKPIVGDFGRNPMLTAARPFFASCPPEPRVIERDVDETDSIVIVIDDDLSFRRSTERLIRSVGYSVQSFGTAAEFLRSRIPDVPACRVLDVRLPGLSGLDLQEALPTVASNVPITSISSPSQMPM